PAAPGPGHADDPGQRSHGAGGLGNGCGCRSAARCEPTHAHAPFAAHTGAAPGRGGATGRTGPALWWYVASRGSAADGIAPAAAVGHAGAGIGPAGPRGDALRYRCTHGVAEHRRRAFGGHAGPARPAATAPRTSNVLPGRRTRVGG